MTESPLSPALSPAPTPPLSPWWRAPGIRLFLGDVVDVLGGLPAESVDMIFADPPYGLSNGGFTVHAGRRVSVNKGSWDVSRGIEGDFRFHERWMRACRRVLKPNGTLWVSGTYHSIYACGYALQVGGWHVLNDVCWFKPNASPNLSCRMFTASHETLIWARKERRSRHVFNYADMREGEWPGDFLKKPMTQMRSVWAMGPPKREEKSHGKHPTQKPLALLERIIRAASNEGDLVLDPFCGSATTGVAALGLGRSFTGIDAEREYLEKIARPRLEDIGVFAMLFFPVAVSAGCATQFEQVVAAIRRLGGRATLKQIYSEAGLQKDIKTWGTKTPTATIRRLLQKGRGIKREKAGVWGCGESVLE